MWLQVTAMGILVYDISGGSATAVGVLAALNALPFFLGGMLLAGLGDRFDRRKLLIAVQCVQWLVAVALFLLTVTIWQKIIISLLLRLKYKQLNTFL